MRYKLLSKLFSFILRILEEFIRKLVVITLLILTMIGVIFYYFGDIFIKL